MKTRGCRIENGGREARSVLDCGNSSPLSIPVVLPARQKRRQVGAGSRSEGLLHVFALFFLWLAAARSVQAQIYSVDWSTIDGGGGTSTGGVYSFSGTIGQPDADGPMTNGQYSVLGGVWALPIAVQTPGAPMLSIVASAAGQATISWTPATPGFVLQQSASLAPVNWTNSPSGSTNPIIIPATLPTRFYRLYKS